MNDYLFDTDVLIDFFKKQQTALKLVKNLSEKHGLSLSVLSIAELRTGWSESEANFFLPHIRKIFSIEPVTIEIAEYAGTLRREYKHITGKVFGTVDTLIAATAIVGEYNLITRNIRDYPFKELRIYTI